MQKIVDIKSTFPTPFPRLAYHPTGEQPPNDERTVETMKRKRTYIWAYLDGKKLVEVIQAALDNNTVPYRASFGKSVSSASRPADPEMQRTGVLSTLKAQFLS